MNQRTFTLIKMSKTLNIFVAQCCAVLCLQCFSLTNAQSGGSGDTLWISALDPLPRPAGNDLYSGADIPLKLRVKYIMNVADQAVLHVYLEEFPYSAGGCRGAAHGTNGGADVLVTRGSGIKLMSPVWRGHSPLYPKGYIAVGASYSTPDGNREIEPFGYFPICYYFFPPGGQRID